MNREELLKALAKYIGVSVNSIDRVISNAPHKYKHYTLPKRTSGVRHIYHPTPELKVIQRWIVNELLADIPVHRSVYSYREGVSIATHAKCHLRSKYFVRFDFKDFFPSITGEVLRNFFLDLSNEGVLPLAPDAIHEVVRLVCRFSSDNVGGLALSIGAPSSPKLSNMVLWDLDDALFKLAIDNRVIYTRYADDMYFSSTKPGILDGVEKNFREILSHKFQWLSLNERKSLRMTKKRRVIVTGLNLTSQGGVSVGRDLKRKIKTEIYLIASGAAADVDVARLRGLVSYCFGVEPGFYEALVNKFGRDFIQNFMSGVG